MKVYAREYDQHECPGDVRDLGAGGGQGGGGLHQPPARGAHYLLLRLPEARLQRQTGERRHSQHRDVLILCSTGV